MRRLRAAALAGLVALTGCASAPEVAPGDEEKAARINTQLGVAYMRHDQLDQAHDKLQRALRQAPHLSEAHAAMAVLYERMSEPDNAARHHRRAIELSPQDSPSLNNYGRFLCSRKDYSEAERYFVRAAENPLYPTPELPWQNAATCAQSAGDLDKAEQFSLRALQANPRFAPALLRMADLRQASGHALSARGFYQRYLAVAPQTPESLWIGLQIERALGDRSAADSYALLLKGKFPDSDEARRLIQGENEHGG